MLFSKTIKLLICLVLVLPLIVAPQAQAATNTYDHNALAEYEGYGQAMYETIVDQTTFISGQYTDNKQYVKDSITQVKDYANFWLNEQGKLKDACSGTQIFSKSCLGELTSTAGGYALTVGDFIKNLFTDYEKDAPKENIENPLSAFFSPSSSGNGSIVINDGFYFTFPGHAHHSSFYISASVRYSTEVRMSLGFGGGSYKTVTVPDKFTSTTALEFSKVHNERRMTDVGYMLGLLSSLFEMDMKVYAKSDNKEVTFPDRPAGPISNITKYITDGNTPQLVAPQPKAYLSCPDGTRINMAINGATFLDASGKVMNVNKDGTAQVSSQICNLGWEKQKVDYVDDKPAITDPDGNWLDIVSGDLLECVLLEKCEVTKPPAEIEPIDSSLVEYVKNAYEYATGVLKTATDGLKSLGTGAKELTALFGVFFSWLPREMVVLMSSGLALMIGLRLFRK